MNDEISKAIAKAGVEGGIEAAKGFLRRLAGPAVDELGFLLQDQVRFFRLKNQLKILSKAQNMILKSGLSPGAIPLRTLIPLLEGAALENDEYLSSKWAALLANASIGKNDIATHPSFPHILSQLSPDEALFLDKLETYGGETNWSIFRRNFAADFSKSIEEVDQYFGNLFRLALCRISNKEAGKPYSSLSIGPFGKKFLKACSSIDNNA